jgi:hypothetical protein
VQSMKYSLSLSPSSNESNQVLLNKPAGSAEQDYHTHEYADARVSFSNIGAVQAPVGAEVAGSGERSGLMSTQGLLGHHFSSTGQLASSPFSMDDPSLGAPPSTMHPRSEV